ncbi:hypothetical protein TI39_contig541g00017 [Zymoseptoria brevis]|uniref:Major facilitator superfamily (MFS) profile domain-containing protein n=1 Tax=Zymoseptoria brevis TaxID=1047168 RepID=A0A0F4GLV5_9PEZI|nr:hypothetical protein TI39_contig541g00017 [Zymoseptoria brevis]
MEVLGGCACYQSCQCSIFAQIFTVTVAGASVGFIIRELGDPTIAGWIVHGPLLVQVALSPVLGRLSDVLDRKYLAGLPPLVAFAGAVISAKATSMSMLIGGGILIGFTLPTIAIVQAIPSEILPLKYRALSNGLAFVAGTLGAIIAVVGGGRVVGFGIPGWRYIYWMQATFHMLDLLQRRQQRHSTDFLNLGWKTSSWKIALRSLPIAICTILSAPFSITCCYAAINESRKQPQWAFNVVLGIGQSGPLTLLTAYIQFASPPEISSTATGLAYSARALGGALGSAVLNTIINNKLHKAYASSVGTAAIQVPGISEANLGAARGASHTVFAAAYRLAWSSIIPFVVVATICCFFLTDVSHLMTEHIDATVEKIPLDNSVEE